MIKYTAEMEPVMDEEVIAKVKDRYYAKFNNREKVDNLFPKLALFRMRGVEPDVVFVEWVDKHIDILKLDEEGHYIRIG